MAKRVSSNYHIKVANPTHSYHFSSFLFISYQHSFFIPFATVYMKGRKKKGGRWRGSRRSFTLPLLAM